MGAREVQWLALLTCPAMALVTASAAGQSPAPTRSLSPLRDERALELCASSVGLTGPAPTYLDAPAADCRWLTISEGSTDGTPWRVVAAVVGSELWTWVDLGPEATGSGVSGGVPIISAGVSPDPLVAHGSVGPQVARVRLETTGADVDLMIVPLTGIGADAGAFGGPVPPGTEVEWFVALAADGSELDRAVGPAAAPWASRAPSPSPARS